MVEFALILPILILLLCGIIDFGWIFGNQLLASSACREAARYTAIHYNDSIINNDRADAEAVVIENAPTLEDPTVTLTVTGGDKATVRIQSTADVLTPIIASFFPNGKYTINVSCTMRLE